MISQRVNGGNFKACKSVCEVTAAALVSMPASVLTTNDREKLTTTLPGSRTEIPQEKQAWTLVATSNSVIWAKWPPT